MSDLRDQLRKAGLLSEKEARRVLHEQRVHAKQVGREGLEAERRERDERQRAEAEARKQAERARAEEKRRLEEEQAGAARLAGVVRSGWIREATAGSRRFFFETVGGRIRYLDLSDSAARRVSTGGAVIIETRGIVRGDYCVVSETAAGEIARLRPDMVCFWSRRAPAGPGGGPIAED